MIFQLILGVTLPYSFAASVLRGLVEAATGFGLTSDIKDEQTLNVLKTLDAVSESIIYKKYHFVLFLITYLTLIE